MSIKQLEQDAGQRKTFNLSATVASALREACYREDRTQTDITETALTEWLVKHQYMTILDDSELDTAKEGDTND